MHADTIDILTTGGTIDKVYFDALSAYQIGPPQALDILREAGVCAVYRIVPLLRKDSLEIDAADRAQIVAAARRSVATRLLITHGTDTMVATAQALLADATLAASKTIVLVGAMQPALLRESDARFNIGFAWAAVQTLPPGVYLTMNGRIHDPRQTRKNRAAGRFESAD
ncbi:MAG: asparaginase domain-containing protein [Oceanococcaceae bacterium]